MQIQSSNSTECDLPSNPNTTKESSANSSGYSDSPISNTSVVCGSESTDFCSPVDRVSSDSANDSPQNSEKHVKPTVHASVDSGVSFPIYNVLRQNSNEAAVADASSVTVMLDPPQDICRICHGEGDSSHPLIQPCLCAGSLRFVHHPCLQKWILESSTRSCELCRFQFIMSSESKPFSKWRKLDLSSLERRRVICSVSFHIVALVCVIWSLWVLLERTADEVNKKNYGWAFWTKLVVVTVGFTGGVVFMYVQCKMYIRLCRRWRTYNRIIYIQDRRPPGQRYCEGSSGSENQQSTQPQVVILTDASTTSTSLVCKQLNDVGCTNSVAANSSPAVDNNITNNTAAQSNPVTVL